MDGRRRQWQPIATDYAWTRTAKLLADRFGPEGPLVWILVILAAKRSLNQGTIQVLSEGGGWHEIGWDDMGLMRPKFTLKEFFAYTGQIKRTRRVGRQHRGSDSHVIAITSWERWQKTVRMSQKADQRTRKRAQNAAPNTDAIRPTDSDLDLDSDSEALYRTTTPEELRQNAEAARQLQAALRESLRSP